MSTPSPELASPPGPVSMTAPVPPSLAHVLRMAGFQGRVVIERLDQLPMTSELADLARSIVELHEKELSEEELSQAVVQLLNKPPPKRPVSEQAPADTGEPPSPTHEVSMELRCRFCTYVSPPTQDGERNWDNLRKHIRDTHKEAYEQICEHVRKKREPNNLSGRYRVHRGKASLGHEFRRTLGYNSGAPGAEPSEDGDD